MNSIDNRYLLNDEPKTILELISNYDACYSDNKFRLFKKRTQSISLLRNSIGKNESTWGEWIDVPDYEGGLLRAKLNFSKSILQRAKSFFYKDEQFWIYFKLENGTIHKYRIVPKNAVDGLWINPYIFNSDKTYTVEKVMFNCSNQNIITDKLSVNWEKIVFKDNPMHLKKFFEIKEPYKDSVIFHSINNYEQPVKNYWSNLNNDQFTSVSYSGGKSHILRGDLYSSTFSIPMDSIPFGNLRITAECWVKTPKHKDFASISLVLAVDDKKGNVFWKGIPIDDQLLDINQWNNIFNFVEFQHKKINCTLKAYVLNSNNENVMIDDFKIMIMSD